MLQNCSKLVLQICSMIFANMLQTCSICIYSLLCLSSLSLFLK
jgi:hypothetical protein